MILGIPIPLQGGEDVNLKASQFNPPSPLLQGIHPFVAVVMPAAPAIDFLLELIRPHRIGAIGHHLREISSNRQEENGKQQNRQTSNRNQS